MAPDPDLERALKADADGRRLPSLVHLCALESIYRTGSYTKAAVDQGVTLPCISQRVTALEREVGKKLVRRLQTGRGRLEFTADGLALATFLSDWIAELYTVLPPESRPARRTRKVQSKSNGA